MKLYRIFSFAIIATMKFVIVGDGGTRSCITFSCFDNMV